MMDIITEARGVFDIEIEALRKTREILGNEFEKILESVVNCSGKVILTGMGKSGHIASKIAATLSSLGTASVFMHPAEALHGDLGMISEQDVVIAISYSGESNEITRIIPNIKWIGATLISITGNKESTLAKMSDIAQVLPPFLEACYLGLAPTSSTTAMLCYGDALAIVASKIYGFDRNDFGKFHPSGALGKKLILKVEDLMESGEKNAVIGCDMLLDSAVLQLSKKGLGIVSIIDSADNIVGVITDGDLRRQLEKKASIYELSVKDVMSREPFVARPDMLVVDALNVLKEHNISAMPVCINKKVVGTIRLQDIINAGIIAT